MRKLLFIILFVFVALCLALWGSRNPDMVTMDWVIFTGQYPMSQVMAILLAMGYLMGIITAMYVMAKLKVRKSLKDRRAKKQAQAEQAEAERMANTALTKADAAGQGNE